MEFSFKVESRAMGGKMGSNGEAKSLEREHESLVRRKMQHVDNYATESLKVATEEILPMLDE